MRKREREREKGKERERERERKAIFAQWIRLGSGSISTFDH